RSVRELERARDANLVAMMRALKGTDWGAGRLLNAVDGALGAGALEGESLVTIDADWLDGGGAIREARLAALFESATEACVGWISADIAEGAAGRYAQTKSKTRRLASPAIGDRASVATRIASRRGAKLRLAHALVRADGTALATGESELTFVCAETREVRPPSRPVARRLTEIARAQASID
ncbi:MAG: thioesterase family protein, partial [Pseudomonadota bacterium]